MASRSSRISSPGRCVDRNDQLSKSPLRREGSTRLSRTKSDGIISSSPSRKLTTSSTSTLSSMVNRLSRPLERLSSMEMRQSSLRNSPSLHRTSSVRSRDTIQSAVSPSSRPSSRLQRTISPSPKLPSRISSSSSPKRNTMDFLERSMSPGTDRSVSRSPSRATSIKSATVREKSPSLKRTTSLPAQATRASLQRLALESAPKSPGSLSRPSKLIRQGKANSVSSRIAAVSPSPERSRSSSRSPSRSPSRAPSIKSASVREKKTSSMLERTRSLPTHATRASVQRRPLESEIRSPRNSVHSQKTLRQATGNSLADHIAAALDDLGVRSGRDDMTGGFSSVVRRDLEQRRDDSAKHHTVSQMDYDQRNMYVEHLIEQEGSGEPEMGQGLDRFVGNAVSRGEETDDSEIRQLRKENEELKTKLEISREKRKAGREELLSLQDEHRRFLTEQGPLLEKVEVSKQVQRHVVQSLQNKLAHMTEEAVALADQNRDKSNKIFQLSARLQRLEAVEKDVRAQLVGELSVSQKEREELEQLRGQLSIARQEASAAKKDSGKPEREQVAALTGLLGRLRGELKKSLEEREALLEERQELLNAKDRAEAQIQDFTSARARDTSMMMGAQLAEEILVRTLKGAGLTPAPEPAPKKSRKIQTDLSSKRIGELDNVEHQMQTIVERERETRQERDELCARHGEELAVLADKLQDVINEKDTVCARHADELAVCRGSSKENRDEINVMLAQHAVEVARLQALNDRTEVEHRQEKDALVDKHKAEVTELTSQCKRNLEQVQKEQELVAESKIRQAMLVEQLKDSLSDLDACRKAQMLAEHARDNEEREKAFCMQELCEVEAFLSEEVATRDQQIRDLQVEVLSLRRHLDLAAPALHKPRLEGMETSYMTPTLPHRANPLLPAPIPALGTLNGVMQGLQQQQPDAEWMMQPQRYQQDFEHNFRTNDSRNNNSTSADANVSPAATPPYGTQTALAWAHRPILPQPPPLLSSSAVPYVQVVMSAPHQRASETDVSSSRDMHLARDTSSSSMLVSRPAGKEQMYTLVRSGPGASLFSQVRPGGVGQSDSSGGGRRGLIAQEGSFSAGLRFPAQGKRAETLVDVESQEPRVSYDQNHTPKTEDEWTRQFSNRIDQGPGTGAGWLLASDHDGQTFSTNVQSVHANGSGSRGLVDAAEGGRSTEGMRSGEPSKPFSRFVTNDATRRDGSADTGGVRPDVQLDPPAPADTIRAPAFSSSHQSVSERSFSKVGKGGGNSNAFNARNASVSEGLREADKGAGGAALRTSSAAC